MENGVHMAVPIYVLILFRLLLPRWSDTLRVHAAYKGRQVEHRFQREIYASLIEVC